MRCIKFVLECCVVVNHINSTLSSLRLGDADEWRQLFTDGKPRLQIVSQNLVIEVMVDPNIYSVIVSSFMFPED